MKQFPTFETPQPQEKQAEEIQPNVEYNGLKEFSESLGIVETPAMKEAREEWIKAIEVTLVCARKYDELGAAQVKLEKDNRKYIKLQTGMSIAKASVQYEGGDIAGFKANMDSAWKNADGIRDDELAGKIDNYFDEAMEKL